MHTQRRPTKQKPFTNIPIDLGPIKFYRLNNIRILEKNKNRACLNMETCANDTYKHEKFDPNLDYKSYREYYEEDPDIIEIDTSDPKYNTDKPKYEPRPAPDNSLLGDPNFIQCLADLHQTTVDNIIVSVNEKDDRKLEYKVLHNGAYHIIFTDYLRVV